MMGTDQLDREGIFRAVPQSWLVRTNDNSDSIGIAIEFAIVSELQDGEWLAWPEGWRCWGTFYVIKRDGQPSTKIVEQLSQSIGWDGSLVTVANTPPPNVEAQITVKENVWEGKSSFRASWINPSDFVPTAGGADESEAKRLDAQFGTLLRAAAGGAKPVTAKPRNEAKEPPPPRRETPSMPPDDIPF